MLAKHLITSLRHIRRNRINSAINVISLTIGLTISIVIFTIIQYQYSFDHHHQNADRVFRVNFEEQKEWGKSYNSQTPEPLHKILRTDYPQIEAVSRTIGPMEVQLFLDEVSYRQEEILFVDEHYFKLFDQEWIRGNAEDAFKDPKAIILTESMAVKLFGTEDPMGKAIDFQRRDMGTVRGIIKDVRKNSNMPYVMLAHVDMMKQIEEFYVREIWGALSIGTTWVLLPENVNPEALSSQFEEIIVDNLGEDAAKVFDFSLGPLKTLHTDDRYGNGVNYTIPSQTIYALGAIAFIILATCLINFVNLTTAQALKRSPEVGIRKILGSNKSQLAIQNFIELAMLTFTATFFSIWLAEVLLHRVNIIVDVVSLDLQVELSSVLFAIGLSVVIILSAGFYPTAMFMAFKPIEVLKGKFNQLKGSKATVRNSLLIIQFVFAQVLVIILVVFNQQFSYIKNKDLGFETENIVGFRDFRGDRYMVDQNELNTTRNLLLESPYIEAVTHGTGGPSATFAWSTIVYTPELGPDAAVDVDYKHIDHDYRDFFDLEVVAGNWFTKSNYYDSTQKVMITELLVEKLQMGSPEEAIGKRLTVNGQNGIVSGVLADFHTGDLTSAIKPSIFEGDFEGYNQGFLKFKEGYYKEAMEHFEKVSTAYNDDYTPFYMMYTDELSRNYQLDQLMFQFINFVAILALVIGSLGLYSLLSFVIQQRTKELGIRKVIGANTGGLMMLLSKKFIFFIVLATILAAPLGYLGAEFWLERFTYRTNMGVLVFIAAFAITGLITMGSIAYRTFKAATLNPINSLRYE